MLNPRILVMFGGLPDGETALTQALLALSRAGRPFGVRFALPARFEPAVRASALPSDALSGDDLVFFDDAPGLAGVLPHLTDETHFLFLCGPWDFASRWDSVLLQRYAAVKTPRALLTAVITGEGAQAQPCLPAFVGAIDGHSAALGAGMALVCGAAPVRTLIVHPGFLFGRTDFLRVADLRPETLSVAAFVTETPVFALDRAALWPLGGQIAAELQQPGPEALPPPVLNRFEQRAGISFSKQTVTLRAMQGLFGPEDGYAQRMPPSLRLESGLRTLVRRSSAPELLIVTAMIDLPDAPRPPQLYLMRFSFLRALRQPALTLYAGGATERALRQSFPNTLAYPDNSLLPRSLLSEGITPRELFLRNKLLLMYRTQHAYPTFSHLAWLDVDALPHPVCPDAVPDFSALTDDRVHIAWVNGEADATMVVVPRRLLKLLVREVQSVTQLDGAMQRSFSETELYRRLMLKYPDFFTLHPMPRRGLLFPSCFDPRLLSAELSALLGDLPDPIRVPSGAPVSKEKENNA